MSNLEFGYCLRCNDEKWSKSAGIFQRRYTGKCLTCGYTLVERKDTRRNDITSSPVFENTTNFYDIPMTNHSTSDKSSNDSFSGHGGSFGGGGASSSWDSSDSSSSSSDSGSSSSSD